MNTAIQDAHNLAWKLAMVYHGQACHRLLSTYESEVKRSSCPTRNSEQYADVQSGLHNAPPIAQRRPVAIANTALSLRNYEKTVSMTEAVGLHREHPFLVNALAAALPFSDATRSDFVQGAFRIGQAPLATIHSH